jgi:non-ribosomal peptide synthetase component E (peptide arylation enzyme)
LRFAPAVVTLGPCCPTTWVSCSTRPLAVSPSRPDTTFTFAELDAGVKRVANGLAGLGVRAGDQVALRFGNDWRFLAIDGKSASI